MKSTLVWDWPVRILHWLMVLLFTGLILTGKSTADYVQYHFHMGYGLSAVIVARVLYGFCGSYYARFCQFVRGPNAALTFVKSLLSAQPKKYLGHNPLGGLMVVTLLLGLSVQWGTGLFTSDEIFWFGPFYGLIPDAWASELASIHRFLPNVLLGLVALHVLAVLYHELCLKERLIEAMIHGRKKHPVAASVRVQTPRWGVIFSLLMGLAWLAALWMMPI
ncbi:branched-chain alpha-keto acid dehydrogenase subunit E2 [Marinomonas sp. M1K-6]|uniref:Branched-chain alpha-keto acid dehydrogenase subunit E2 n=1 Tax=Marinomonas profundi TaxID=2726122 RepID=A0A847QY57_9GAMM|nr:cytochrome b/b6 domain-containing protein [Marinomonas profundi]NLQ17729.1 branched-chain alpha-keto acid dehydrogenase subunit E2 [Marinomonas profundi]UDV04286.1 cytochrome b/b6 domain-containing protein [Marinomonas profundi]